MACAHRIARAGPSKLAKNPSPAVYLLAAKARKPRPDSAVMFSHEIRPSAVTEAGGARGRPHDVGEQDGRERALVLRLLPLAARPDASEEGIDLGDNRLPVAEKREVLRPLQFDERGARDLTGCPARTFDR